ncbi:MAG: DUF2855 family protein [Acidimicrobiia bacterium]|jgi:NADPH:quinone reductase-like Zn-dependent oxidoreductase|nr:DUF2855 family protein [Acidimicrobiia bacterium]
MDLLVARGDLRRFRFDDAPVPEPGPGEARLRISSFALTANNITYAAFGDIMSYWSFFPAEPGWGRIPVWGFATVDASNIEASGVDGLVPGERVYGYFPMSSHLVVTPSRVSDTGFVDAAPHRAALPPVYNRYTRLRTDPALPDQAGDQTPEQTGDQEGYEALLRPLFTTSFLIDDWLDDNETFGATQVVITSASSKTALALAFLLEAFDRCRVVGLTAPGNLAFVEGVGYYDEVVAYGGIDALASDVPTVLVDMAGDGAVLSEVHGHFADHLLHSCRVGATHWEDLNLDGALPGPEPKLFFAPDHIVRRHADWGPGVLEQRAGDALGQFIASARDWLTITEAHGEDAVAAAYLDVLEGRARPDRGYVLSLDRTQ